MGYHKGIPYLQYIRIFLIHIKPIRSLEKLLRYDILFTAITPISPIPEYMFTYRNIVRTCNETHPHILDDISLYGVLGMVCTYKLSTLFYMVRTGYIDVIV